MDTLLYDEDAWDEDKSYITDIIDDGVLEKARGFLQNERGSISLGVVSTVSIGALAGACAASSNLLDGITASGGVY